MQPPRYGLECLSSSYVKYEERAAGTSEVGAGDRFVGFLAGGIPEGELHSFLLGFGGGGMGRGGGGGGGGWRANVDDSGAEFDADCYVVVGDEAAFAEADC